MELALMLVIALSAGLAATSPQWVDMLHDWLAARRARKSDQQTPLGESAEAWRQHWATKAALSRAGWTYQEIREHCPRPDEKPQPMTDQEFIDSFKKGSK